jgi:hypothetical protein
MKKIFFIAAVLLLSQKVFSQGSLTWSGMKFNLNEDGSKYMRFIAWNQIWLFQMNPGTMIGGSGNNWNRYWQQTFAFLAYSKFLKIHDCYPLWYTTNLY